MRLLLAVVSLVAAGCEEDPCKVPDGFWCEGDTLYRCEKDDETGGRLIQSWPCAEEGNSLYGSNPVCVETEDSRGRPGAGCVRSSASM